MTNEITKGLPAIINGQPVVGSIDMNAVINIGTILVFFYACSGLFSFIEAYMMASATQRISKNLRTDISSKINRMPKIF